MTTLQVAIKLRVYAPHDAPHEDDAPPEGEAPVYKDGVPLGELQASGTLSIPTTLAQSNQLSAAMRTAIKDLWESQYGTGMATGNWYVTIIAEHEGRVFEDVRMQYLPLDFQTLVMVEIQTMIEMAIAAIA